MTRVLVAGGAGYIGSHTVKELRRQGFEIVVFDDLSTGKREFVRESELVVGDLEDREDVRTVFKTGRIDAVLHFASLIQVGESYVHPRRYYTQNLSSSLNLLDAMLESGVGSAIFSSSAAVYGVPRQIPIPEDHPLSPFNPYGQTKFFVEQILRDYDRAYGLKFISLRYFNASGADPDGELGECHNPETHLIPNLLAAAMGRKDHLEIYGTDFPTPDGTAIRDYIHVSRPGLGPRPGPPQAPGRAEERLHQPRDEPGILRPRDHRRGREDPRPEGPQSRCRGGRRRSGPPRLQGQGRESPRLGNQALGDRDDHRNRPEVARVAIAPG